MKERIKERKLNKIKKQNMSNIKQQRQKMNKDLTGTATLLNKNDTSNLMDPNNTEDNEEYDYFYQNDDSINISQTEIAKIT